jgi:hypothetical protein
VLVQVALLGLNYMSKTIKFCILEEMLFSYTDFDRSLVLLYRLINRYQDFNCDTISIDMIFAKYRDIDTISIFYK